MKRVWLPDNLEGDAAGFSTLGRLALRLDDYFDEEVELHGLARWCDGHLCAALGGLLAQSAESYNSFRFSDRVGAQVLKIWGKNGFWRAFGGVDITDEYDTTLAFERFEFIDEKRFASYVQRELMPKELPKMGPSAKARFASSLQEVFNNALIHSASGDGVFTCGQNYPSRDRISFSVADLGVGFRSNIEEFLQRPMSDCRAIDWAIEEGHTTKREQTPGGLGMAWLWEFVRANRGALQIVSHHDFWEGQIGEITRSQLSTAFPGTVVTIHINTWDDASYEDEEDATTSIF